MCQNMASCGNGLKNGGKRKILLTSIFPYLILQNSHFQSVGLEILLAGSI